jgi:hypothetical protein
MLLQNIDFLFVAFARIDQFPLILRPCPDLCSDSFYHFSDEKGLEGQREITGTAVSFNRLDGFGELVYRTGDSLVGLLIIVFQALT